MNLILLFDSDFISPHRVRLSDRRFTHIKAILKPELGQVLTVGKINSLMGQGKVISISDGEIDLEVDLGAPPPQALPLTLVLALPRPPMLKRILFSAAMLGVKKIIILNFNRVEKSLWNSSSLKPDAISEQLILGLEQAKDTLMPEVILKKSFKPFVRDELPALIKNNQALVAHPHKPDIPSPQVGRAREGVVRQGVVRQGSVSDASAKEPAQGPNKHIILIIGPEGGIIDYEIGQLTSAGCQLMDLGPRILRTESVLPFIVGKLFV